MVSTIRAAVGDLQHSVKTFPFHNRIPGSFVEVHDDPYPKPVEMADYPFVVISCRHSAGDQELPTHDSLRYGGNDGQQSRTDNVLPDLFIAKKPLNVTLRLRSSFQFIQNDVVTILDHLGIHCAGCRIIDVLHISQSE
jgi:hypothetical protein